MTPDPTLGFQDVHRFLSGLVDGDLHAKRVLSLANAARAGGNRHLRPIEIAT